MNTNNEVYLTGFGIFLPGSPIKNEDIDNYLGVVSPELEKLKKVVLRSNGIKERFYALDSDGNPTHLSEDLAVSSAIAAITDANISPSDVDLIVAATTLGDLIVPAFGQQLHGKLAEHGLGEVQCITSAGVCLSGMTALEDAAIRIQLGKKKCALVNATERPSIAFRSSHYNAEFENEELLSSETDNYKFLDTAFLRWMLSDGSGSFVLQNHPKEKGMSLRLDWIDLMSHADQSTACMYMGTNSNQGMTPDNTWLAQETLDIADSKGMLNIRQDAKLLKKSIASLGMVDLKRLIDSGKLNPSEISHFLPHLSSYSFAKEVSSAMEGAGYDLAENKWFTNLRNKGNTGCAAIFIILEEAVKNGLFKNGEKILIMVPESARFSYCYAQFTCVEL